MTYIGSLPTSFRIRILLELGRENKVAMLLLKVDAKSKSVTASLTHQPLVMTHPSR
jgi:hypothetical protein